MRPQRVARTIGDATHGRDPQARLRRLRRELRHRLVVGRGSWVRATSVRELLKPRAKLFCSRLPVLMDEVLVEVA
jgi:hypothetical protein